MQCCGLGGLPQAHWVPDGPSCSGCGSTFTLMLRRHHCRCCGALFCDACSRHRTIAPGWGFDAPVRTCDECHALEVRHLPVLLAGHAFGRASDWSTPNRRYLRLSYDQATLIWCPWRDDDGADESQERSVEVSQLTCVSVSKGSTSSTARSTLVVQVGEAERLNFEGRTEVGAVPLTIFVHS